MAESQAPDNEPVTPEFAPGKTVQPDSPASRPTAKPTPTFDVDKHEAANLYSEAQLATARQVVDSMPTDQVHTQAAPSPKRKPLVATLAIAWALAFVPVLIISFILAVFHYAQLYEVLTDTKASTLEIAKFMDDQDKLAVTKGTSQQEKEANYRDYMEQNPNIAKARQDYLAQEKTTADDLRSRSIYTFVIGLVSWAVALLYLRRQGLRHSWVLLVGYVLAIGIFASVMNYYNAVSQLSDEDFVKKAQRSRVEKIEDSYDALPSPMLYALKVGASSALSAGISFVLFQGIGYWRYKDES